MEQVFVEVNEIEKCAKDKTSKAISLCMSRISLAMEATRLNKTLETIVAPSKETSGKFRNVQFTRFVLNDYLLNGLRYSQAKSILHSITPLPCK